METTRDGNGVVLVVVLLFVLALGSSEGRIQAVHPIVRHGGGLLRPPEMEKHRVREKLFLVLPLLVIYTLARLFDCLKSCTVHQRLGKVSLDFAADMF